jgi:hypothetical protein
MQGGVRDLVGRESKDRLASKMSFCSTVRGLKSVEIDMSNGNFILSSDYYAESYPRLARKGAASV